MALMKGSGGSREAVTSAFRRGPAPAPPKKLAAPKPQRATSGPFTPASTRVANSWPRQMRAAPAPARSTPQPARQQTPFFQLAPQSPLLVEVVPESRPVQIVAERENDPIEIDQGPRTVDAALRSTWGQLGNEGLSGYIKLTDTDGTPAALRRRGQDMGAYYDTQARLARREQARTTREAADRQETEQQLTVEEWNSLTPLQQAAAQMNADLAQAIQKDLEKRPHAASREQLDSYQTRVDELFGGRGGTGFRGTEYAPNTIAFLDAREIKAADLAGKTLDDFLSGDVLLSIDEVKKLGDKGDVRASRKSLANRLATGQLVFQEKLASTLEKGTELLSSVSSGVTSVEATGSYGARSDLEIPLDKVQPETAAQFPKYLQALARSDIDLEAALETINLDLQQRGATEEEAQVIWDGLMKRTNQSAVGAGEWFPDSEIELRSPLEVAQALGVPTLKRQFITGAQRGARVGAEMGE